MRTRLTDKQKNLLEVLSEDAGLYCELYQREHRTAKSLERRGLIKLNTSSGGVIEARLVSASEKKAAAKTAAKINNRG